MEKLTKIPLILVDGVPRCLFCGKLMKEQNKNWEVIPKERDFICDCERYPKGMSIGVK